MLKRKRSDDEDENDQCESENENDSKKILLLPKSKGITDDEWLDLLDPTSPKAKHYTTTWERFSNEKIKNEEEWSKIQGFKHSPIKTSQNPSYVISIRKDVQMIIEPGCKKDDNSVVTVSYLDDEDCSTVDEEQTIDEGDYLFDCETQKEYHKDWRVNLASSRLGALDSAKSNVMNNDDKNNHIQAAAKAGTAEPLSQHKLKELLDEQVCHTKEDPLSTTCDVSQVAKGTTSSIYAYGRVNGSDDVDSDDDCHSSHFLGKKRPWARSASSYQSIYSNYITPPSPLVQVANNNSTSSSTLDEDDRKMPAKPIHDNNLLTCKANPDDDDRKVATKPIDDNTLLRESTSSDDDDRKVASKPIDDKTLLRETTSSDDDDRKIASKPIHDNNLATINSSLDDENREVADKSINTNEKFNPPKDGTRITTSRESTDAIAQPELEDASQSSIANNFDNDSFSGSLHNNGYNNSFDDDEYCSRQYDNFNNIVDNEEDEELQQALLASLQDSCTPRKESCLQNKDAGVTESANAQVDLDDFVNQGRVLRGSSQKKTSVENKMPDNDIIDLCDSPVSTEERLTNNKDDESNTKVSCHKVISDPVREPASKPQSTDEAFLDLTQDDEMSEVGHHVGPRSTKESDATISQRIKPPSRKRQRQSIFSESTTTTTTSGSTDNYNFNVGNSERLRQMEQAHQKAAAERERIANMLSDLEKGKYRVQTSPTGGSHSPSIGRIKAQVKTKLSSFTSSDEDSDQLLNMNLKDRRRTPTRRKQRTRKRKRSNPKPVPSPSDIIVID